MEEENKLRVWLIDAVKNVQNDGITRDIHVDELLRIQKDKKQTKLQYLLTFFQNVVKELELLNTDGLGIFLAITLNGNSKSLQGCPKIGELDDLLNKHWKYSEVIVYKPYDPTSVSLLEFYRVPIVELKNQDNIDIFYKEYRMNKDEGFERELNVVYNFKQN